MSDPLTISLKKYIIAERNRDGDLKARALAEIVPFQRTLLHRARISRELMRLNAEIADKSPDEVDAIIERWENEIYS